MKKLGLLVISAFAISAHAADFSGKYQCSLLDEADGKFASMLELSLNKAASRNMAIGYASYDVRFNVANMAYAYQGIAAAQGNNIAIYFESVGKNRNPDDRGVGIASVILDKDKNGKDVVSLHKFYYEKSYKGKSDTGFENCVKEGDELR